MDTIFKSLKRKLSVDNLFKGKDEENINKDEDVRKTLEKIEPNDIIHVDELTEKLNEITEKNTSDESKSQSSKTPDKSKSSYSVLQKTGEEEDPNAKPDNVMAFLD